MTRKKSPDYQELLRRILALEKGLRAVVGGGAGGGGVALHASTHSDGGTDEVNLLNLGGYPGGTTSFLRADGSFASVAAGSVGDLLDIQFARKTGDTSRTNDTITDDPDLLFPVGANQVWTARGVFLIDGDDQADFDWSWTVPSGTTGWHSGHRLIASVGAATSGDLQTSATETLTADRTAGLAAVGTLVMVTAEAYFDTDSTTGNINLRWAQNVTDAQPTILKAGSFLIAHRWV